MEYEYIGVRQATKIGYIKCAVPGCADLSYPTSKLRRGRVQGGGHVAPTITTSGGYARLLNGKKIIVIGSINPEKECQDRVRVLNGGGYLSSVKIDRL